MFSCRTPLHRDPLDFGDHAMVRGAARRGYTDKLTGPIDFAALDPLGGHAGLANIDPRILKTRGIGGPTQAEVKLAYRTGLDFESI